MEMKKSWIFLSGDLPGRGTILLDIAQRCEIDLPAEAIYCGTGSGEGIMLWSGL